MSCKANEPAFPVFDEAPENGQHYGLTKRDYFAAKAMQADASDGGIPVRPAEQATLAKYCYSMADAMLAQRTRCSTCDGTGDAHALNGEWLGRCDQCSSAPIVSVGSQLGITINTLRECRDVYDDGDVADNIRDVLDQTLVFLEQHLLEIYGWQPIETAPKGVTDVLDLWGANGKRYCDCIWAKPTYENEFCWVHEGGRDCDGPVDEKVPSPTHWRRPPIAPTATGEQL